MLKLAIAISVMLSISQAQARSLEPDALEIVSRAAIRRCLDHFKDLDHSSVTAGQIAAYCVCFGKGYAALFTSIDPVNTLPPNVPDRIKQGSRGVSARCAADLEISPRIPVVP